ncbi:MAG: carbohydrate-binding domain-containing protein [Candidatus Faecivicinus sp.]
MKRKALLTFLALALFMTGCARQRDPVLAEAPNAAAKAIDTDLFTDRDLDAGYDENTSALIQLNGSSAACSSAAVQISGSTVAIVDEGTYILSGALDDGMIIVNADKSDKIQLVLNGVALHSATSAPIYVLQADKVFITLADGTENALSNGGSFEPIDENNIDAVIFSKDDLTLNGSGSLTVTSPAGHGIVSKDALCLTGGTYQIDAASHGITAKDSLGIVSAEIHIASGKDGLHAENADDASLGSLYIASGTLEIAAEGDGLSASSAMQIDGGSLSIVSGGGSANAAPQSPGGRGQFMGGRPGAPLPSPADQPEESSASAKGIKSDGDLLINGGDFEIDAADDAVHTNGNMTVNGGSFEIATGDDGFHADGLLSIASGAISITKSYEGLEGLSLFISGGELSVTASDDGLNAAGGNDQSGFGGQRGGDMFGSGSDSSIDMFGSGSDSSIDISGGELYISAGGDAIDSNGSVSISGGSIVISGPISGDTSLLDYGSSGAISGGTFVATGSAAMSVGFGSSSTQGSIMVALDTQPAGTLVTLTDPNGSVLLSRQTDQDFSCVLLSCPGIVQGSVYTLAIGSETMEITMDSLTYSNGSGRMGGMGGNGGMGGKPGKGGR